MPENDPFEQTINFTLGIESAVLYAALDRIEDKAVEIQEKFESINAALSNTAEKFNIVNTAAVELSTRLFIVGKEANEVVIAFDRFTEGILNSNDHIVELAESYKIFHDMIGESNDQLLISSKSTNDISSAIINTTSQITGMQGGLEAVNNLLLLILNSAGSISQVAQLSEVGNGIQKVTQAYDLLNKSLTTSYNQKSLILEFDKKSGVYMDKETKKALLAANLQRKDRADIIKFQKTSQNAIKNIINLSSKNIDIEKGTFAAFNDVNDSVFSLNEKLGDKNDLHREQQEEMRRDIALGKMFFLMWDRIYDNVVAADEAANNFNETNYRLYGTQYDLLGASRAISTEFGVTEQNAIRAYQALANVATPIDQIDDLAGSIAKASVYTGISVDQLAELSRITRLAGGDVKNFDSLMSAAADTMRRFGLNSQDVNAALNLTNDFIIQANIRFGKFTDDGRNTVEVIQEMRLELAGLGKSLGLGGDALLDYTNILTSVSKKKLFENFVGMRLSIENLDVSLAQAGLRAQQFGIDIDKYEKLQAAEKNTEAAERRLRWFTAQAQKAGMSVEQFTAALKMAKKVSERGVVDPKNVEQIREVQKALSAATKAAAENPFDEANQTLSKQIEIFKAKFDAYISDAFSSFAEPFKTFAQFLNVTVLPIIENVVVPLLKGMAKALTIAVYPLKLINQQIMALRDSKFGAFLSEMATDFSKVAGVAFGLFSILAMFTPKLLILRKALSFFGLTNSLNGLGLFGKALKLLLSPITLLRTAVMSLGSAILTFFTTNPFGWAILAAVAIYALYKRFETVRIIVDKFVAVLRVLAKWGLVIIGAVLAPFIAMAIALGKYMLRGANIFLELVGSLINAVMEFETVRAFFSGIKSVIDVVISYIDAFVQSIDNISFDSLVDGFMLSINQWLEWFSSIDIGQIIYDYFVHPILATLGIASPSKVMLEIGQNIIKGLVNGIMNTPILGTMFKFVGKIASFFSNIFGSPEEKIAAGMDTLSNMKVPTAVGEEYKAFMQNIREGADLISGVGIRLLAESVALNVAMVAMNATAALMTVVGLSMKAGSFFLRIGLRGLEKAVSSFDADATITPLERLADSIGRLNDELERLASVSIDNIMKIKPILNQMAELMADTVTVASPVLSSATPTTIVGSAAEKLESTNMMAGLVVKLDEILKLKKESDQEKIKIMQNTLHAVITLKSSDGLVSYNQWVN